MSKSQITKIVITGILGMTLCFAGMLYKLEMSDKGSQIMGIGIVIQICAAIMAGYFFYMNRKNVQA